MLIDFSTKRGFDQLLFRDRLLTATVIDAFQACKYSPFVRSNIGGSSMPENLEFP
jgi:hypothetical protein